MGQAISSGSARRPRGSFSPGMVWPSNMRDCTAPGAIPLTMTPHLKLLTDTPVAYSETIITLERDFPRAAKLIKSQQNTLMALEDIYSNLFRAFQGCGFYFLVTALLLFLKLRKEKNI